MTKSLSCPDKEKGRSRYRMQPNHTITLLGLPEFNAVPMIETNSSIFLRIEKNSMAELCPCCGATSRKIHDRRKQPLKDLPLRNKQLILVLIKRRFRCPNCNKVFIESYQSISRYQRMTIRLIEHITKDATRLTFKAAAVANGVSSHTARSLFISKANRLVVDKVAPSVLAMDEFAVKKGKGENKYNLAIAVPSERRLLDILPDRRQASVEAYLNSLVDKQNVKVMVIDMWRPYKRATEKTLPRAAIVVDKFHVIRNVMWALDRVRRRIVEGDRDLRKRLKRSRYLLLKNYDDLDNDGRAKLIELLECSEELKQTYWFKEWFRVWYHEKDPASAAYYLDDWLANIRRSEIKEMLYVANTVDYWKQEILNYFTHRLTTGFLEGTNNKIKTIKRMAYGFRTPGILRAKVLLADAL